MNAGQATGDDSPNGFPDVAEGTQVLVLFSGDSSIKWLRLLAREFRHCFVAVACGAGWITLDPLSHQTGVSFLRGMTVDELSSWYERQGVKVVRTSLRVAPRRPAPLAPFTCVEAVKRILGIHALMDRDSEATLSLPWQAI